MKRRTFMISAGAAAGAALLPRTAFADANRIDWYTSSDANVTDFWTNIVVPKFVAANPGVTVKIENRATDEHKSALRVAAGSNQASTSLRKLSRSRR